MKTSMKTLMMLLGFSILFTTAFAKQEDDCKQCTAEDVDICNSMAIEKEYYGCHTCMDDHFNIGVGLTLNSSNQTYYLGTCAPDVAWKDLVNRKKCLTSDQVCCMFQLKINITNKCVNELGINDLTQRQMSGITDIVFSEGCEVASSSSFIKFFQLIVKKDLDSALEVLKQTDWCKRHSAVPGPKGTIDRCSRDIKCIKNM